MVFVKREEGCCYRSFLVMFDFLSFGLYNDLGTDDHKPSSLSPRRSLLNFKDLASDQVKISR